MEDLEFTGLLSPHIQYKTKSGEVFFSMKRKSEWGPPTYYVFELNDKVLTDEEKTKFNEAWNIIKMAARACRMSLFDSREIQDAVMTQIKKVLESEDAEKATDEADRTGEITLVRDIDISLFNHATGRITSLQIGISVPPGSAELIKESLERSNL